MPVNTKSYMQQYAQANRTRLSAYKVLWNKERLKDPEYRARQNELQRKRREEKKNPDVAAKARIRTSIWKKKNSGKVVAAATLRKKRVKERTPSWLDKADMFAIECVYTYCAALRNVGLKYEVDHEIPLLGLNVSGLHVPSNLRVIHENDNRSKSNRYEV